ncbi:hypothetical protein QN382_03420 [Pseudomonas sp. 10B1]|uniref:hypothetical protein n=1 Tax=Pseudomonas sp. 10B1 TaxID=3048573 RepID=UPI002B23C920|nr:hypothetical protein [Pseudomonas sp. 10B1]MEB0308334.1 hypothetical protein [Pseudomonas sp. 10B1]
MPFQSMMKDKIDLLKQNGTRTSGIKSSVQKNKIITFDSSVIIEPRDLLIRLASNGAEETYEVIDPVFHEGHGGIPASYQIDVRKLGVPEAKQHVQSITFNVTGPGARVNSNSTDNSTNTINTGSQTFSDLQTIRRELASANLSQEQATEASDVLDAVEQQLSTPKPNRTVVKVLLDALPSVATIGSAVASIVSSIA